MITNNKFYVLVSNVADFEDNHKNGNVSQNNVIFYAFWKTLVQLNANSKSTNFYFISQLLLCPESLSKKRVEIFISVQNSAIITEPQNYLLKFLVMNT
jgi:hypothetical protein